MHEQMKKNEDNVGSAICPQYAAVEDPEQTTRGWPFGDQNPGYGRQSVRDAFFLHGSLS